MNIGMLWLDADGHRTFIEKVNRAVDYYKNKYGQEPDLCIVNNSIKDIPDQIGSVRIEKAKNVLEHHFWIGMKQT